MNTYLPEGMQIHTGRHPKTPDDLRRAMQSGEIITATALLCDEAHNLHVSIAGVSGVIPRAEAALGVAQGTVRDIAILSRVGKPVCCKVQAFEADGTVRLSRVAAQQEALHFMTASLRPGDIIPAVVTSLTNFGAFCDVGCGVIALLGIENISVSRISHARDRFREGQQIYAVVQRIDPDTGRISLTHKELLGTWEENAACFQAGQTVTGTVRSVKDYGVFIELAPNLSGLAEPDPALQPGDTVSVYLKSILPDKMKIKLSVIEVLDAAVLPRPPLRYTRTNGHLDFWQYSPYASKLYTVFES